VKVTPFNSANGIFIDWIFSSGVMDPPAFLRLFSPTEWMAAVNQAMTSEVMASVT
jgi:hypothetical protein